MNLFLCLTVYSNNLFVVLNGLYLSEQVDDQDSDMTDEAFYIAMNWVAHILKLDDREVVHFRTSLQESLNNNDNSFNRLVIVE